MQAQIDRGITDAQTLFYAMLFGLMNLIANYPRATTNAPDPDTLAGMMAGLFIAYVFFLPLMLFGIAGIIHWTIRKLAGGQSTWIAARRALVWSAVVTSPLILAGGMSYVFNNSLLPFVLNVITAIVFLSQLWKNFIQVEFK
jgi:hypothetical protein